MTTYNMHNDNNVILYNSYALIFKKTQWLEETDVMD
jgi:hypothetical protein